jgi:hypothetical protein
MLAQFVAEAPVRAFHLFVRSASKIAYSEEYLRLCLAEQIHAFLGLQALEEPIGQAGWNSLILKLRGRRGNGALYFVIDGLHQVPQEDWDNVGRFLRELPIGLGGFHFVITGDEARFRPLINNVIVKTFHAINLHPADCSEIISDLGLTTDEGRELVRLCRSSIGRLAAARRLLKSGASVAQLISSGATAYPEFAELELRALESLDELGKTVLGVLVFGRLPLGEAELSLIVGAARTEVGAAVARCTFIQRASDETLEFISETHRVLAEQRLAAAQPAALTLLVNHLRQNRSSSTAVRFLIEYYKRLNDHTAVVDALTPEHYGALLNTTQSVVALRTQADAGVESAIALKNFVDVFRFNLQKSIFAEVAQQEGAEAEIGALVAIGRSELALHLVAQAVSIEHRLSLLAAYAGEVKKQNGIVDSEIRKYIKELTEAVNFTQLGDRANDIAADLLFVDPDLAMSIVDKGFAAQKEKDFAFARLALKAALSTKSEGARAIDEQARQRIRDEALQRLMGSFAGIVSDLSVAQLIAAASDMEVPRRMFFIRSIAKLAQNTQDALDLVDYALDQSIKESAYTPRASDLAELARILIAAPLGPRLQQLVKRFDSQLGLLREIGFSRDVVTLQMRLARVEGKYDSQAAMERLLHAYDDIASLPNPESRLEGLAIMLRALEVMDESGDFERKHGFKAVIRQDLTAAIETVIAGSADHLASLRGVIRTLARTDPAEALSVVKRLNTKDRRNEGLREVARNIVGSRHSDNAERALRETIEQLSKEELGDSAILTLVNELGGNKARRDWQKCVRSLMQTIRNPVTAARAGIVFAQTEPLTEADADNLCLMLDRASECCYSTLEASNLYFEAVPLVAKVGRDRGERLFEKGAQLRSSSPLHNEAASDLVRACIALLLRTATPLLRVGSFDNESLVRVAQIINIVPSVSAQAALLADLALRSITAGDRDFAAAVVSKHLLPLIRSLEDQSHVRRKVIRASWPAIYRHHTLTAMSFLEELAPCDREAVLADCVRFMVTKRSNLDPWADALCEIQRCTHEEMLDVIQLIRHMFEDSTIYGSVDLAVKAIISRPNRTSFTRGQRADYARALTDLVDAKLPDKDNIQHQGYKILAKAHIWLIEPLDKKVLTALIKDAEAIPNVSDRAFVLVQLAELVPERHKQEQRPLIEKANKLLDSLPSLIDKLHRRLDIARVAKSVAPDLAKPALQDAMASTASIDDEVAAARHRRNILDLAEQLPEGIAEQLVDSIDDDPARQQAKREAKQSLAAGKLKKELTRRGSSGPAELSDEQRRALPDAAWKGLEGLLDGRLAPMSSEEIIKYVCAASEHHLQDAYSVLAWYLENLNARAVTRSMD